MMCAQADRTIGGFSEELAERERTLKRFMYANLYHHPTQIDAAAQASVVIADLFAAYCGRPCADAAKNGEPRCRDEEPQRSRHIADFLAGMTDRFAQKCHREIMGEQ